MTAALSNPEVRIALIGLPVAFLWEMWQMPFYDMDGLSVMAAVRGCSLGAFGDAGIMVLAYSLAAYFAGGAGWLSSPSVKAVAIYLVTGVIVTIAAEAIALNTEIGWGYSEKMPVDPLLGIGLVPLLMWIIVPLVTLALARHHSD